MSKIKALVRDQLLFLVITFENSKVSFLIALLNGPIPRPPIQLKFSLKYKTFQYFIFSFSDKVIRIDKII